MDSFAAGTVEYDEAHGLYRSRRGQLAVVDPGGYVPRGRRWERVASLAHPGVAREMAETPAGRRALLDSLALKHYGLVGQGQGVDVSEFQSSTPSGFSFAVPRLLNENSREDSRWRMHKANFDAWGVPCGAYGIIRPGTDPVEWAHHFVALLAQSSWAFIPTIDVELGDPAANRGFVAAAVPVLKAAGYTVVMGYFSWGSSYRFQTQDLFDRKWGAAWGSGYPAGADVHQWQGSPLDRDYCPNFQAISLGSPGPVPPEDDVPYTPGQLVDIFKMAQKNLLATDADYVNNLLSLAGHSPMVWNQPGYEDALNTVMWTVNQTPISATGGGETVGEALSKLVGVPHAPLTLPARSPKDLVVASDVRKADDELARAIAQVTG